MLKTDKEQFNKKVNKLENKVKNYEIKIIEKEKPFA